MSGTSPGYSYTRIQRRVPPQYAKVRLMFHKGRIVLTHKSIQ